MQFFKHTPDSHLMDGFKRFLDSIKSTLLADPSNLNEDGYLVDILADMEGCCLDCIELTNPGHVKNSYLNTLFYLIQKDLLFSKRKDNLHELACKIMDEDVVEAYLTVFLTKPRLYSEIAFRYEVKLGCLETESFKQIHQKADDPDSREELLNEELNSCLRLQSRQEYTPLRHGLLRYFERASLHFFTDIEASLSQTGPFSDVLNYAFINQPLAAKIKVAQKLSTYLEHIELSPIAILGRFAQIYFQSAMLEGKKLEATVKITRDIITSSVMNTQFSVEQMSRFTEQMLRLAILPFPQHFNRLFPGEATKAFFESLVAPDYDSAALNSAAITLAERMFIHHSHDLDSPLFNSPFTQVLTAYGIDDFDYRLLPERSRIGANAITAPSEYTQKQFEFIVENCAQWDSHYSMRFAYDFFFHQPHIDLAKAKTLINCMLNKARKSYSTEEIARIPELRKYFLETISQNGLINNANFMEDIKPLHKWIGPYMKMITEPAVKKMLLSSDLDI